MEASLVYARHSEGPLLVLHRSSNVMWFFDKQISMFSSSKKVSVRIQEMLLYCEYQTTAMRRKVSSIIIHRLKIHVVKCLFSASKTAMVVQTMLTFQSNRLVKSEHVCVNDPLTSLQIYCHKRSRSFALLRCDEMSIERFLQGRIER